MRNPFRLTHLITIVAVLLVPNLTVATTPAFSAISQSRSVATSGEISVFDGVTGQDVIARLDIEKHTATDDFSLFDQSIGLGTLVLDNPSGSGHGSGRTAQTSSFTANRIQFRGDADVFMESAGGAYAVGHSFTNMNYSFSVDRVLSVALAMDSEILPRHSEFEFLLKNQLGDIIWGQTALYDDYGIETRTFTQQLTLNPGVYSLTANLSAESFSQFGDNKYSGRSVASFSITAVPEPESYYLLLIGLSAIGLVNKKRQARN